MCETALVEVHRNTGILVNAKVYYTYGGIYFVMSGYIILMMVCILLCQGILNDGIHFAMPRYIILMMLYILLCQGILYL